MHIYEERFFNRCSSDWSEVTLEEGITGIVGALYTWEDLLVCDRYSSGDNQCTWKCMKILILPKYVLKLEMFIERIVTLGGGVFDPLSNDEPFRRGIHTRLWDFSVYVDAQLVHVISLRYR